VNLGRHKWLMLVCMLAPVAALSAIFLFNVPAGRVLGYGLFLLCPIMHLFMMRGMSHGGHSQAAGSQVPTCHEGSDEREQPQPGLKRLARESRPVETDAG